MSDVYGETEASLQSPSDARREHSTSTATVPLERTAMSDARYETEAFLLLPSNAQRANSISTTINPLDPAALSDVHYESEAFSQLSLNAQRENSTSTVRNLEPSHRWTARWAEETVSVNMGDHKTESILALAVPSRANHCVNKEELEVGNVSHVPLVPVVEFKDQVRPHWQDLVVAHAERLPIDSHFGREVNLVRHCHQRTMPTPPRISNEIINRRVPWYLRTVSQGRHGESPRRNSTRNPRSRSYRSRNHRQSQCNCGCCTPAPVHTSHSSPPLPEDPSMSSSSSATSSSPSSTRSTTISLPCCGPHRRGLWCNICRFFRNQDVKDHHKCSHKMHQEYMSRCEDLFELIQRQQQQPGSWATNPLRPESPSSTESASDTGARPPATSFPTRQPHHQGPLMRQSDPSGVDNSFVYSGWNPTGTRPGTRGLDVTGGHVDTGSDVGPTLLRDDEESSEPTIVSSRLFADNESVFLTDTQDVGGDAVGHLTVSPSRVVTAESCRLSARGSLASGHGSQPSFVLHLSAADFLLFVRNFVSSKGLDASGLLLPTNPSRLTTTNSSISTHEALPPAQIETSELSHEAFMSLLSVGSNPYSDDNVTTQDVAQVSGVPPIGTSATEESVSDERSANHTGEFSVPADPTSPPRPQEALQEGDGPEFGVGLLTNPNCAANVNNTNSVTPQSVTQVSTVNPNSTSASRHDESGVDASCFSIPSVPSELSQGAAGDVPEFDEFDTSISMDESERFGQPNNPECIATLDDVGNVIPRHIKQAANTGGVALTPPDVAQEIVVTPDIPSTGVDESSEIKAIVPNGITASAQTPWPVSGPRHKGIDGKPVLLSEDSIDPGESSKSARFSIPPVNSVAANDDKRTLRDGTGDILPASSQVVTGSRDDESIDPVISNDSSFVVSASVARFVARETVLDTECDTNIGAANVIDDATVVNGQCPQCGTCVALPQFPPLNRKGIVFLAVWHSRARRMVNVGTGTVLYAQCGMVLILTCAHIPYVAKGNQVTRMPRVPRPLYLLVGVFPEDESEVVFRYSATVVDEGTAGIDACVLRVGARLEHDIKEHGDIQSIDVTRYEISLADWSDFQAYDLCTSYNVQDPIQLAGFSQSDKSPLVPNGDICHSLDVRQGRIVRARNTSDGRRLISIQGTQAIQGHSGCPMLDLQNKVIGILYAGDDSVMSVKYQDYGEPVIGMLPMLRRVFLEKYKIPLPASLKSIDDSSAE